MDFKVEVTQEYSSFWGLLVAEQVEIRIGFGDSKAPKTPGVLGVAERELFALILEFRGLVSFSSLNFFPS